MYFNVFTNLYITYLFLQTYAQSTLTKKGRKKANMAYGCPQLLYLSIMLGDRPSYDLRLLSAYEPRFKPKLNT